MAKIWILNHHANSPDMPGGTRHYDLGKELTSRGHSVTIFASGYGHFTHKYVAALGTGRVASQIIDGVEFVWLRTGAYEGNDWRRVVSMVSYACGVLTAKEPQGHPDVIIGSSPHPLSAVAAWWLSKRHKASFVFEVRDFWPKTAIDMGAMKPTGLAARILFVWEKAMFRLADRVIVLPPNALDYITGRGISPDKVVHIPNGVDLSRFQESQDIKPLIEKSRPFRVVYAGAHGPANGLEVVLEAATHLRDCSTSVHIYLVGDGTEKQRLQMMASSMGVDDLVTFLDPLPKANIAPLLMSADLLLHCLRPLEVFEQGISPNKMFDYLASGRPIIVSARASNDIVSEANAGLTVTPGDSRALAEGILTLARMSESDRDRLGQNGRNYVEHRFACSILGERLDNLVRSLPPRR